MEAGVLAPTGVNDDPSPLRLVATLSQWVDTHNDSLEYGEIAKRAAADAIVAWTNSQQLQPSLLAPTLDAAEVWRRAGNGAAFSEIARSFLASFTNRYLAYFVGRESSAHLKTLGAADDLPRALGAHVDDVLRYAFETSKIAQSFAAGWYNKYVPDGAATGQGMKRFLRIAYGKMKEEIHREAE